MAIAQAVPQSNRAKVLDEIVVEAKIDALNAVLADRGISADRIISVIPLPGQTLVSPTPPQYRVLYRAI
jgi:1,6-anhydro-N-acetylmuramate kinase